MLIYIYKAVPFFHLFSTRFFLSRIQFITVYLLVVYFAFDYGTGSVNFCTAVITRGVQLVTR